MIRTVTVGPFPVQFGNVNQPMGLAAHRHTAAVTLVYATLGRHGYPSFRATNDAIREYLRELTARMFRDATNEDVVDRLFEALDGWRDPSWEKWGGEYRLDALHLDVQGVLDDIGHDEGTTRYTTARGRRTRNAEGVTIAGAATGVQVHVGQPAPGPDVAGLAQRVETEVAELTRRQGWGQ
jgi:hypothetical protein